MLDLDTLGLLIACSGMFVGLSLVCCFLLGYCMLANIHITTCCMAAVSFHNQHRILTSHPSCYPPVPLSPDLAARSLRDPSDQDESPNIYVSQTDKKRLVLGEMKATSTLVTP